MTEQEFQQIVQNQVMDTLRAFIQLKNIPPDYSCEKDTRAWTIFEDSNARVFLVEVDQEEKEAGTVIFVVTLPAGELFRILDIRTRAKSQMRQAEQQRKQNTVPFTKPGRLQ